MDSKTIGSIILGILTMVFLYNLFITTAEQRRGCQVFATFDPTDPNLVFDDDGCTPLFAETHYSTSGLVPPHYFNGSLQKDGPAVDAMAADCRLSLDEDWIDNVVSRNGSLYYCEACPGRGRDTCRYNGCLYTDGLCHKQCADITEPECDSKKGVSCEFDYNDTRKCMVKCPDGLFFDETDQCVPSYNIMVADTGSYNAAFAGSTDRISKHKRQGSTPDVWKKAGLEALNSTVEGAHISMPKLRAAAQEICDDDPDCLGFTLVPDGTIEILGKYDMLEPPTEMPADTPRLTFSKPKGGCEVTIFDGVHPLMPAFTKDNTKFSCLPVGVITTPGDTSECIVAARTALKDRQGLEGASADLMAISRNNIDVVGGLVVNNVDGKNSVCDTCFRKSKDSCIESEVSGQCKWIAEMGICMPMGVDAPATEVDCTLFTAQEDCDANVGCNWDEALGKCL